jgi:hypothetical protein
MLAKGMCRPLHMDHKPKADPTWLCLTRFLNHLTGNTFTLQWLELTWYAEMKPYLLFQTVSMKPQIALPDFRIAENYTKWLNVSDNKL